jgi:hypothetical protein
VTLLEIPADVLFATDLLGTGVALLYVFPFTNGVLLNKGDPPRDAFVGVPLLDRTASPFGTTAVAEQV